MPDFAGEMFPPICVDVVRTIAGGAIPQDEPVRTSRHPEEFSHRIVTSSRRELHEPSVGLLAFDPRPSTLDDCFLLGFPDHFLSKQKTILCRMNQTTGEVPSEDFLERCHAVLGLPLACDLPCKHFSGELPKFDRSALVCACGGVGKRSCAASVCSSYA